MILRVPASSANLGPGFDTLGIAWQLYNRIEFTVGEAALLITGCDSRYADRSNLAYRGYLTALRECGAEPFPLTIHFIRSDIPVSRGLGSSAALYAAGLTAANELHELGLSRQRLFELATSLEGHPDNVAPALFGGLSVSVMGENKVFSVSCPVSGELYFTALVPDLELSTELCRSVLPPSYSRADAVYNLSRSAMMLKALETGREELLREAMRDRIHQPYRTMLIPGFETARALAEEAGCTASCISGAGSTQLCVSRDPSTTERLAALMKEALPRWRVLPLRVDTEGTSVEE